MKPVTTILFVENDAVALTMYQKRLQREGFHVETAEDGIAALRVLSEMTPDIVILDLMLPKFSGRDVFDYMRADVQFKKVPVIIFSNAPRTEWPLDLELSPTRAMPKSEANFASLLEQIREMIAAAAVPDATPALAVSVGANGSATATQPLKMSGAPANQVQPGIKTSAPVEKVDAADNLSSAETVEQFLEYVTAEMTVLREHCLAYIKGPNTDQGRSNLSTLRQRLQTVAAGAQKANCARLALLANAWDMLLGEIERKPSVASPSILQTLAQAADCLRILLSNGRASSMEPVPKAKVLSVDDDEICNHVAIAALEKANMAADSVTDANAALELLKERDYDMVLLDINMPVLTGFELCERLRGMPHHQKTPVIFVTAYNNFENRKQSVLSGGGDLIAKPVSPLELALKVTIHLLKAPPKTVTAPKADAKPEPALVWKEPVETISHDSEARRNAPAAAINGAKNGAAPASQPRVVAPEPPKIPAPKIELPKTEAARIQAPKVEPPKVEPPKIAAPKIEAAKVETPKVEAPKVAEPPKVEAPKVQAPRIESPKVEPPKIPAPKIEQPKIAAPKIPAPKIESPKVKIEKVETPAPAVALKPEATKALAAALQPATPASAPAVQKPPAKAPESKPVLESVAPSRPLPEKSNVVPTQPSRTTQPATTPSGAGSKSNKPMTKETNQQFETLVLDVAHIIFGDNAPDINVRLVRMALEQVWQNRANLESIDSIAREIARIIFGEASASDLNVRLVRMALERSNSIALFKAA